MTKVVVVAMLLLWLAATLPILSLSTGSSNAYTYLQYANYDQEHNHDRILGDYNISNSSDLNAVSIEKKDYKISVITWNLAEKSPPYESYSFLRSFSGKLDSVDCITSFEEGSDFIVTGVQVNYFG